MHQFPIPESETRSHQFGVVLIVEKRQPKPILLWWDTCKTPDYFYFSYFLGTKSENVDTAKNLASADSKEFSVYFMTPANIHVGEDALHKQAIYDLYTKAHQTTGVTTLYGTEDYSKLYLPVMLQPVLQTANTTDCASRTDKGLRMIAAWLKGEGKLDSISGIERVIAPRALALNITGQRAWRSQPYQYDGIIELNTMGGVAVQGSNIGVRLVPFLPELQEPAVSEFKWTTSAGGWLNHPNTTRSFHDDVRNIFSSIAQLPNVDVQAILEQLAQAKKRLSKPQLWSASRQGELQIACS